MKVRDLLGKPKDSWKDRLCLSRLIAIDGKDGKILFDTDRNTRTYIEKFFDGEVSTLWSDVVVDKDIFISHVNPVMKCYITHGSWDMEVEVGGNK